MYSSMIMSYQLALTETGDCRELIPEIISLPEMYKNNFSVNFGVTQENTRVDSVKLPSWANEDPYYFTYKMRELFEHDEVSLNIGNWIDLIFGYKQKGEAAVEACNLYPSITYENGIDINKPENQEILNSLTVQAYNYGQCPTQLFTDPHPKKDLARIPVTFMTNSDNVASRPCDSNPSKLGRINTVKFIDSSDLVLFGKKRELRSMTYAPFAGDSK